jgi:hypothetical protein
MFIKQNSEKKIQELILENERLTKETNELFTAFETLEGELEGGSLAVFEEFKKSVDKKIEALTGESPLEKRSLPQSHWLFVR